MKPATAVVFVMGAPLGGLQTGSFGAVQGCRSK